MCRLQGKEAEYSSRSRGKLAWASAMGLDEGGVVKNGMITLIDLVERLADGHDMPTPTCKCRS